LVAYAYDNEFVSGTDGLRAKKGVVIDTSSKTPSISSRRCCRSRTPSPSPTARSCPAIERQGRQLHHPGQRPDGQCDVNVGTVNGALTGGAIQATSSSARPSAKRRGWSLALARAAIITLKFSGQAPDRRPYRQGRKWRHHRTISVGCRHCRPRHDALRGCRHFAEIVLRPMLST